MNLEYVPLRVFVVWNPAFSDGRALAQAVYDWFGGPRRSLHRSGLGIPVSYWTTGDPEDVPGSIPTEDQGRTVVVALVDEHFAGRVAWRRWLEELEGRVELRFWAIHSAAFQLEWLSRLNPLGTRECTPEALRRLLTESCATLLVRDRLSERRSSTDPALPENVALSVFISYARRDGSEIASQMRQALLEYGNVQVFMDVHDIEPGSGWKKRLEAGLDRGAAMLAVVTDEYSSRAWCRKELREFRTPWPEDAERTSSWWLRPMFVLDALSGTATRSMFEVGSAPTTRWLPESATEVIDLLIRDILFGEVRRRQASQLAKPNAHVINWVPDTWTLLELTRLQRTASTEGDDELAIVYPGDGLPVEERSRLKEVFPHISLHTFEEEYEGDGPTPKPPEQTARAVVAFSAGDPPPKELLDLGLSPQHLDDAVLRLARTVLRGNHDIAYAGYLRGGGFAQDLSVDAGTVVPGPRFVSFLGWPFYDKLTPEQIADTLGLSRYVKIVPSDVEIARVVPWSYGPDFAWAMARATTETRRALFSKQTHLDIEDAEVGGRVAQILVAGKTQGFLGLMPGIAEEVLMALDNDLAVFIVGAFGGAARTLARFLAGGPWPPEFTFDAHIGERNFDRMREVADVNQVRQRYSQLRSTLTRVRDSQDLNNGLTWEQNLEMMSTGDIGTVVRLFARGLRSVTSA